MSNSVRIAPQPLQMRPPLAMRAFLRLKPKTADLFRRCLKSPLHRVIRRIPILRRARIAPSILYLRLILHDIPLNRFNVLSGFVEIAREENPSWLDKLVEITEHEKTLGNVSISFRERLQRGFSYFSDFESECNSFLEAYVREGSALREIWLRFSDDEKREIRQRYNGHLVVDSLDSLLLDKETKSGKTNELEKYLGDFRDVLAGKPRALHMLVVDLVQQTDDFVLALNNAEDKSCNYVFTSSGGNFYCFIDSFRHAQVIDNLTSNAVKANATRINLSLERSGPWIILCVSNNGDIIPKRKRRKIFRTGYTTRSSTGGSGLGLAISKEIVRAHGGKLFLESSTNEWTTFAIVLPATKKPEVIEPTRRSFSKKIYAS